jgi:hypothetical protein
MNIPPSFVHSYERFESYPRDLVYKSSSSFALEAYKTRLDEAAPKLCVSDDSHSNVPFLDSPLPGGQGERYYCDIQLASLTIADFTEEVVRGDTTLKVYLGDQSAIDPSTLRWIGPVATKKDPKCRFM